MSTSLKKIRVYCLNELKWTEGWTDSSTDVYCFNNNEHSINPDSVQTLDTTEKINVTITQEFTATGGHFLSESYAVNAPANTTTNYDISWPIPVNLQLINVENDPTSTGNILNGYINPMTPVGVITSDFREGQKKLSVNKTVIDNILIGYECFIEDYYLGRIINIDADNLLIVVEFPLDKDYNYGAIIKIQLIVIKNFCIGANWAANTIGGRNIGTKYLPAGYVLRASYTNKLDVDKLFRFNIEFLY